MHPTLRGLRTVIAAAIVLPLLTVASSTSASAATSTTNNRTAAAITAAASSTNLLANPGLETPDSDTAGQPASWTFEQYGSSATATYPVAGLAGSSSAKLTVTSVDGGGGDAKWVPAPVGVTPGQLYSYSDIYRATVPTHVVYQAIDGAGNSTYNDVQETVPASPSTTATARGTFKVPAGTVKLSVLHLLERPGSLTIDNVSLVLAAVKITDRVPNNSVETSDPNKASQPQAWSATAWGTNVHKFTYVKNDGHAGQRSVRTCITKYGSNPGTAGDAKWMFDGAKLTRGGDYRATFWYKTNALSKANVVARFVLDDGTEDFFGLPQPEPKGNKATAWTKYTDVFNVPANAVSANVFMILRGVGCVSMDDFHLTPYHYTGFDTGRVVLTFDDNPDINALNALPVLTQYKFKTTQYVPTGDLQKGEDTARLRKATLKFVKAGHEIGSHTVTHPHLTTLSCSGSQLTKNTKLTHELVDSRSYLRKLTGQKVTNFASPFGEYNACVNRHIKAAGYGSHRTVDEGFNSRDNFNPYRLRVQNMTPDTTQATYQGWLAKAAKDRTTLVIVYHNIDQRDNPDQPADTFDTYLDQFKPQMAALNGYVKAGTLKVQTIQSALSAMRTQTA